MRERKRIKELIRFPFKLLFQASLLFSLLFFIILYFGQDWTLEKSVFSSFLLFTALYLGIGVIIVAITLVVSEKKKKELEEQKSIEAEQAKENEEKKIQKLTKLETDIKEAERRRSEELQRFREQKEAAEKASQYNPEEDIANMTFSPAAMEINDMSGNIPADEFFDESIDFEMEEQNKTNV